MGYRSCVAMLVYGTPEKVDMIDALLLQTLSADYDRGMFEATKQVRDEDIQYGESKAKERSILWTFDDIKWYSELDKYKDDVFNWVAQVRDETPDHERDWSLCVDFVRVGEENTDVEEQYSDNSDYRLCVRRTVEIPDNFEWRA